MPTQIEILIISSIFLLVFLSVALPAQSNFIIQPAPDGFITSWLILGPFSNSAPGCQPGGEHGTGCYGYLHDLLANEGGEARIVPFAGASAVSIENEKHFWRPYFSPSWWIDFNSIFEPNEDVVAYAHVCLNCTKNMQVTFGLSQNDGMKLWLNGELLHDEHQAHLSPEAMSLPVNLKKGTNHITVKVDEKKGGWGFGISVRFAHPADQSSLTFQIPAPRREEELQALLFEIGFLPNAEPLVGEPVAFKLPLKHCQLPCPVRLPILVLNADQQLVDEVELTLPRKPGKDIFPINLNLPAAEYTLVFKDRPALQKKIEYVEQKVFNEDFDKTLGQRPYEMGDRPGYPEPLIDFEDLSGWWLHSQDGTSARLYRSRAEQMDGKFVAKIVYRGQPGSSSFEFGPPKPIPIEADADGVGMWIFGNNWGWIPDPTTPPVEAQLILIDEDENETPVSLGRVNWKGWFLCWTRVEQQQRKFRFKSIRILGGTNHDDRTLYFDSIKFTKERWQPLDIQPLPDLLPILTTRETIVPVPKVSVDVKTHVTDNVFRSVHHRGTQQITFIYAPDSGTLSDFTVQTSDGMAIQPFVGGDIEFPIKIDENAKTERRKLIRVTQESGKVLYNWSVSDGKSEIGYVIALSARYQSLLIDVRVENSEWATGLNLGHLKSSENCKLVRVPFLTYGMPDPCVVCSGDVFILALLDHYRSHASALFAQNETISPHEVQFNGGSRYEPRTDGHRNPLKERIVLTVSADFQDVLPNIPHPTSEMGHLTRSRCWRQHWGMHPDTTAHEQFYKPLKQLREYGVSHFIVRHHEETWRDDSESFTLRLQAAPKKGGDEALKHYVNRVKDLGFLCGLYTNYIDFAPVNANWSPDRVARQSDGNFVGAWPRCYTLKPSMAVKFEAEYAPKIHQKFGANTVYCDVHTAVKPWERVDFDARVPEAAMFRAQHKAYSLLLANEKKAYAGPVFSEGLYHWFYAGLTDGNYGQIRDSEPHDVAPLVDFDLLRIHPLEVDIGMGGPFMFYRNGVSPGEMNSRSEKFDRFLAATIAYGHNGYLLDENWGIPAQLKSYYMMQQLQTRYALQPVKAIAYFDGQAWLDTNDAIRTDCYQRGQIRTQYADGTKTVVNLSATETLHVKLDDRDLELPPNGYVACGADFFELSGNVQSRRIDLVSSPEYVYADGRGTLTKSDDIAVTNSAVILKEAGIVWIIPIDEADMISFRLGALGLGDKLTLTGCDRDSQPVSADIQFEISNGWLTLHLNNQYFKYQIAQK
ncbi:hypothetical protein JXJ21_04545 [candidate division KSB1 bacterium]|nr:hypothetical protein [candidate division KSB1 bacterium]